MSAENREWLSKQRLPAAAREQIAVAIAVIDAIDLQLEPLDNDLRVYARKQAGCKALTETVYGVGGLTAVTIVAELGDARRFAISRDVVRYSGLDVTVHQSDQRRAAGRLSRQGPPALRWALYEAALRAGFPNSPNRDYYLKTAERIGGQPRPPRASAQAAQTQLPHPQSAR